MIEVAPVVAVAAEVVHEAAAEGGAPARLPAKCRRAARLEGVEQALVHLPHEKHSLDGEQANKSQRSCLPPDAVRLHASNAFSRLRSTCANTDEHSDGNSHWQSHAFSRLRSTCAHAHEHSDKTITGSQCVQQALVHLRQILVKSEVGAQFVNAAAAGAAVVTIEETFACSMSKTLQS